MSSVPDDPAQCLIVRHSYSDSAWWRMPGGGYGPGRETPQQAGVREVSEELALTVTEAPAVVDTVRTTLQGKRHTLTIVQATPVTTRLVPVPGHRRVPSGRPSRPASEQWLGKVLVCAPYECRIVIGIRRN